MKVRKRPIVVEAMLYDGNNAAEILFWIGSSPAAAEAAKSGMRLAYVSEVDVLRIRTLESADGWHVADVGDWIIQGIKGEFYPCKPDVFEATYDRVET